MGQCASNKSKQFISKKKCKHPFVIIPYSKKELTGDKPRAATCGVASSFGFKRRVVSAPAPTQPVHSFGGVTMETGVNKLEVPVRNKFGFRSRSVSRTGSNNSVNSNHSNQSNASSLVKKPVDNYRNTQLVTNINKHTTAAGKITSPLVNSQSSGDQYTRPSNLNRLPTTTSTGVSHDTTNVPRNINSRSGIPSLRPVSISGIPSLTKFSSGYSTTGTASNLPTRPISWGNGPGHDDKTVKQVYNTRVRTQAQPTVPSVRPSRLPAQSVGNSKLPRTRRLEMVASNNDRCRFELKDVEVTQVVPIKPDKKQPPARGTVYGTLCKPTPLRRSLGVSTAKPTPPRPLSSLMSSSSDESDTSELDTSPSDETMKTVSQGGMMTSGSDMDGYPDMDAMEGSGDAMAVVFDEEEAGDMKQDDVSPEQSLDVNPNMRSILLDIEDPAFAVLAAMSSNDRLEDVNAPDSPSTSESTDLGIVPHIKAKPFPEVSQVKPFPEVSQVKPFPEVSQVKPFPEVSQAKPFAEVSPKSSLKSPPELESPSTPTNVSLSDGEGEGGRGQDFLIDDEISDQPGLVFDEDQSAALHRRDQSLQKLNLQCQDSPARSRGTLSPCSSITSEDLMLDFELSEADGSQRLADKTIENLVISNPPNALSTAAYNNNNNNYNSCNNNSMGRESTYVGTEEDDDDCGSVSTDSGYSFLGHLEDDVACIKTELVTLRNILSRERDSFTEKEADLKRQIALLRHECMEQVRVASLLREELEIYKSKDQKRKKQVTHSNVATQTERSRPSSLGYVSEGSDGSTRSLISSDEQAMSTSLG